MKTLRKFWFVLIGSVMGMVVIACSCGSLIPTSVPTAVPVIPIVPTMVPQPTTVQEPSPSMAGYWKDPENNDVHTIEWQDGKYVVTNSASPINTLTITSQSWENGILTWTYLVQSTGYSVTFKTTSVSADSLYTDWSNDKQGSGTETLMRVSSPIPVAGAPTQAPVQSTQSMAGRWNDPDTTGTVTTIIALDGGYTVDSVINPNRGGNELTKTSWANRVLTWTYCIPNGNCITSVAVSVSGDSLYTTWTDDRGYSGQTTLQRVP